MGKPEISFFSSTFKRHSNFSQTVEKQLIQGAVNGGSMSTIRFEKTGDLLGYTYFTIDDNNASLDHPDWTRLIDYCELLIGGQIVDTIDSVFTEKIAIDTFANNVSKSSNGTHPGVSARSYFYPLRHFFCESPQMALPLVALNYHNVELRIHWGPDAGNYQWSAHSNYYYLDNEERGTFASRDIEMLIFQVQKNIPSNETIQELHFNHPVKYIASSNTSNYSALTSYNNKVKVTINGVDIDGYKWARPHFIEVMNYYHTNFVTSPDFFLFCFCLTTSLMQPTGTLNFSRLDDAKIFSETMPITDPIYAVNYNILKISNGVAGLLYAN
jgi:hypothetical protein